MRITRKTTVASVLSAALVAATGTFAAAAVFDLPLLGFGAHPAVATASPAAPVALAGGASVDAAAAADETLENPAAPDPIAGVDSRGVVVDGSGAPRIDEVDAGGPAPTAGAAPTAAPRRSPPSSTTTVPKSTTTVATTTTPALPAPPAGCREPEWDREHRVWQCSNDTGGD